jgi:hypothetical protein
VEFSAEDSRYLNRFRGLLRVFPDGWWGNVRLVIPYFDHQLRRSRLVHHGLLVMAYFSAFRVDWEVPWYEQPVGGEYELRLTEFASSHDLAAYNSWVRHFDDSRRLAEEASKRGDYLEAMLGNLLLTMVTFWLGRFRKCVHHGEASMKCAMESRSDEAARFLKELDRWTWHAHWGIEQYLNRRSSNTTVE